MHAYWLTQSEKDVPPTNDWLCAEEIARLNSFRFPKRRADWRLGRWTAKQAIAACLRWPTHPRVLAKIEIRATLSGAPKAVLPCLTTPLAFSLSHRAGVSMCVVSPVRTKLGCDLEIVELHSQAFLADYFTPEEQALVARAGGADRPELLTLLWSAKESALKALGQGLRLDTRSVEVAPFLGQPDVSGWSPLQVLSSDNQMFRGWWRKINDLLLTVVSDRGSEWPILLQASESAFESKNPIDLSNIGRIGLPAKAA